MRDIRGQDVRVFRVRMTRILCLCFYLSCRRPLGGGVTSITFLVRSRLPLVGSDRTSVRIGESIRVTGGFGELGFPITVSFMVYGGYPLPNSLPALIPHLYAAGRKPVGPDRMLVPTACEGFA